jgi:FMN phosphatase YigB (HAD superfamily)
MVKAVCFDYFGVFTHDQFYANLKTEFPQVWEYIQSVIFEGEDKLADHWMRAEYTYQDINRLIARETGINFDNLTKLFIESVRQMRIDKAMLQIVEKYKTQNIPIAIVTNNMDAFSEITVPQYRLDQYFPVIVNSFNYKLMKSDENGKLFDIALEKLGLNSYEDVLLIDDSARPCALFELKGGETHRFTDTASLKTFLGT